MKEESKETLILPLIDIKANKRGFTLLEISVVVFIVGIVSTALFYTLTVAQTANKVGLERIYLEADVQRLMEWITRDVRETTAYEIANNAPNSSYIKFRKIVGGIINNTTYEYNFSQSYTEYIYNNDTKDILRIEGNITWYFNQSGLKFSQSPFYTYNDTKEVVPLNEDDLRQSRKLIVNLTAQKLMPLKNETLNYTLIQEIAIRNE